MIRNRVLYALIALLFSTGCSAVDCDQLMAKKISQGDGMLDFNIYKSDGSYWGDFAIYSADHSISHTNNSMQKFRVDINNLEFVKYESVGNAEGRLSIKWKDKSDDLCITTVSENYWNQMVAFIGGWPESKKFFKGD